MSGSIAAQAGVLPPLRLTFADWHNARRTVTAPDGSKHTGWKKKLAHKGRLTQFAYGTSTRSEWTGRFQRCLICTFQTGVFVIDVDCHADFLRTRLARHVGPGDAISHRGNDHYHILVDGRSIPPELWPRQGPIAGGDIKSNGWVPVPGSEHWSGDLYEPVIQTGPVTATPQMIADIAADRADADAAVSNLHGQRNPGGTGTGTGGHPDLPPIETLLATGLTHLRRSNDMYRLACSLYRKNGVTPEGAQAVEQICWRVWQMTTQSPEPFPWIEAIECIDSARDFIQGQQQDERALMAEVLGYMERWSR